MSDKSRGSETPQTNPIDNSNIDKWNFVANHYNLDDRTLSHYVEMDNNLYVCETRTDYEILWDTIDKPGKSKDQLQK